MTLSWQDQKLLIQSMMSMMTDEVPSSDETEIYTLAGLNFWYPVPPALRQVYWTTNGGLKGGSVSTRVALTAYSQMMTPTVAQQNAALQH